MATTLRKSQFEDILNHLHDAVFSLAEAGEDRNAAIVQGVLDLYADKQWTDFIVEGAEGRELNTERIAKVEESNNMDRSGETNLTSKNDSIMNPNTAAPRPLSQNDMFKAKDAVTPSGNVAAPKKS